MLICGFGNVPCLCFLAYNLYCLNNKPRFEKKTVLKNRPIFSPKLKIAKYRPGKSSLNVQSDCFRLEEQQQKTMKEFTFS